MNYSQNRNRLREGTEPLLVGKDGEGTLREFGMDMYALLYFKGPTVRTRNSA